MKIDGIIGVVLAGGQSRRMGRNKALLPFRGSPFIEHAAKTLADVFAHVIVSANDDGAYQFLGLPVVADIHQNCGPLGGIHSALHYAIPESIFVLSCDMPLITPSLIRFLVERCADREVGVAYDGLGVQPLCGLYSPLCLATLEDSLQQGEYAVTKFLHRVHARHVSIPPSPKNHHQSPLLNINTPEEYARCGETLLP